MTQLLVPFLARIRMPAWSRPAIARIEVYRDGARIGLWSISDDHLDAIAFVDYLEMLTMLDLTRRPSGTLQVYILRVVREVGRRAWPARDTKLRLAIRPGDFLDDGAHDVLCN